MATRGGRVSINEAPQSPYRARAAHATRTCAQVLARWAPRPNPLRPKSNLAFAWDPSRSPTPPFQATVSSRSTTELANPRLPCPRPIRGRHRRGYLANLGAKELQQSTPVRLRSICHDQRSILHRSPAVSCFGRRLRGADKHFVILIPARGRKICLPPSVIDLIRSSPRRRLRRRTVAGGVGATLRISSVFPLTVADRGAAGSDASVVSNTRLNSWKVG